LTNNCHNVITCLIDESTLSFIASINIIGACTLNEEHTSPTLGTKQELDWSSASDLILIQACLQENEAAWAILIERYSRLIYTIPLRFGFSKMVADEIFQETCIILLEKLDTLEEQHRLNSWLMTITKRLCIQRIRERNKMPTEQIDDQFILVGATVEEELARVEQIHLIHEAISFLPERDQTLLKLLYFEEQKLPYDEIAIRLDIAKGSIGALRARALQRLQDQLDRLT